MSAYQTYAVGKDVAFFDQKMMDGLRAANIRTSDLDKWSAVTCRCQTLDQADGLAEILLLKTTRVSLWPMKAEWLVVATYPVLAN